MFTFLRVGFGLNLSAPEKVWGREGAGVERGGRSGSSRSKSKAHI